MYININLYVCVCVCVTWNWIYLLGTNSKFSHSIIKCKHLSRSTPLDLLNDKKTVKAPLPKTNSSTHRRGLSLDVCVYNYAVKGVGTTGANLIVFLQLELIAGEGTNGPGTMAPPGAAAERGFIQVGKWDDGFSPFVKILKKKKISFTLEIQFN